MTIRAPTNIEEVRAALRDLDRRINNVGGFAASALATPNIKQVVTAGGGLVRAREKGKLLATDKYDVWNGLAAAASSGLALVSDSTEDLDLIWRLPGEIPITMRFEASAQAF